MRHSTAQKAPDDLLSPTGRPGAVKRTLKVVLILVLISVALAGAAWLAGRSMSNNEYSRLRRVTTTP